MPVIKLREWLERNDFVNVSKGGKNFGILRNDLWRVSLEQINCLKDLK